MTEEFVCKGYWFLPNSKEYVTGILTFSPKKRILLELIGAFTSITTRMEKLEIILGKTDKGDITLVDNRFWHSSSGFGHGISIESWSPLYVLKGHHFNNEVEVEFDKVQFNAFNLLNWINISGLKREIDLKDNSFSINYIGLDDITFSISDNDEAKIRFGSRWNTDKGLNSIELKEQCAVLFEYQNRKKYKEILSDITTFIGFVTLCTFEQSYPMSIILTNSDITRVVGEKIENQPIEILYNHSYFDPKHKTIHPHYSLVKYKDIEDNFPDIVKKWYQNYNNLRPEHILMLGYFKDKYRFSPGLFLDLLRAIESYHRKYYNRKRLPDPENDRMVNDILKKCNWSERELTFLRSKLKRGSTNLKDRIKFLINEYGNIYIDLKFANEKTTIDIVNTRNYYSHLNKRDKEKALEGRELFLATLKLLGLLFSCTLTDCSIDKSVFEKQLIECLYE